MKKQYIFLLVLFLSGGFYSINSYGVNYVNELFNKANKEYHDRNYQQAIDDYLKINSQNYQSPELYYNLGNCYYKTDSIGKSILFYEKAKRLSPSDEAIAFNLQLANLKVTDKIEPVSDFILVQWWNNLVRSIAADSWAVCAIVLLWIGLMVLLFFFFSPSLNVRKVSFFGGAIFLFLSAVIFTFTFSRYHYDTTVKYGVIIYSTAHIMSEPDDKSKELFVLHEGIKVRLLSSSDNYNNIELPDGKQGWVEDGALGKI